MLTRPPRVVFVIGGLDSGGSEQQLTELVLSTHPHALRADIVLLGSGRTARRARLEAAGVRVWDIPPSSRTGVRYAARVAYLVSRQIVRLRPDLVYAWLEESALLAAPSAWARGCPLLVARRNVIGGGFERTVPLAGAAVRVVERRATGVTANSEAGRRFAEDRGIDPARIHVIPNGHAAAPALPLPPEGPLTFGYLARFRPEKGHHRLIEALALLPADAAVRVRLGGDGPLLEQIRSAADAAGVSHLVAFDGEIDDVRGFWADCHAALLLSDHEGQPNALIEAALAGRAAIATDVGGSPEVVLPDGGFVVPLDPAAAAGQIARLASAPADLERLGLAAHRQASARFSMRASVDGHLAAIAEAVGR